MNQKDAESRSYFTVHLFQVGLFRKMIPVFKDAGYRVVVPDMVGFGRSDKFELRATILLITLK